MKPRRGTGLAELLVALALASVIMATAARTLMQQTQWHRDRTAQAQADDVVREVHDVLRAELAHVAGLPRIVGDTALDLASLRIVATACERDSTRLVMPASERWWSPPRAGDSLAVIDTLTGVEWRSIIVAVATQRASDHCPAGGTRLTLWGAPPPTVAVLALPARVWHATRYVEYRASDGTWWLGERSCTPVCGAAQPIAGPLRSAALGGLRLSPLTGANGVVRAFDLSVRATMGARTASLYARLPVAVAP